MLTLTNIKKVFKTDEVETWALQNVNLEVKKGEFVAIMGPSGCGKSTLLNILGLLDTPTEGAYILDGKDVSQMSEDDRTDLRKGKLGFVFQSFNLIDELNVTENVELPLLYMGTSKKERRQQVKDVIERVAMAHRAQHFPAQLSGGQQQRVSIARALAGDPSVILADEPTGALDSKTGRDVMQFLQQLNREGNTIILITHDNSIAAKASRIIRVTDGRIVYDGPVEGDKVVAQQMAAGRDEEGDA